MPFSFTEIEKDKSARIGFVFVFLVFFYFVIALMLYGVCKLYFLYEINRHSYYQNIFIGFSWEEISITLSVALIVGILHWLISVNNIIEKILTILQAQPLDLKDTFHSKFNNILEEVSAATGGVKFQGVVISTSAMNSFALADFDGRYVVGVTEGLLTRLNRAQLETVVAHEVAHVLSGDCLETTITTSMFDIYKDMLSSSKRTLENSGRGDFIAIVFIVYIILQVTVVITQLFKMFISREREYRADAIAVRLTRDPLSLAQALYTISRRWRGFGIAGDGLSAIFIFPPQYTDLDEQEGWFSNLFSTHPPTERRLAILLDMAHSNLEILKQEYDRQDQMKQQAPDLPPIVLGAPAVTENIQGDPLLTQWEVYVDGQWRGPYKISDLMNQEWIEFDTFVRKIGDSKIVRLFEATDIKHFNIQGGFIAAGIGCPVCQVNLSDDMYNGAPISRCLHCGGALLYESDVQKILARDDYIFSDRIKKIGDSIIKLQISGQIKPIDLKTTNLLSCTRCREPRSKMLRSFFTLAYPIEVDRCIICKSVWFDRSELEVLQYMINRYQNNDVPKLL